MAGREKGKKKKIGGSVCVAYSYGKKWCQEMVSLSGVFLPELITGRTEKGLSGAGKRG